jgi:hypothetical protein
MWEENEHVHFEETSWNLTQKTLFSLSSISFADVIQYDVQED